MISFPTAIDTYTTKIDNVSIPMAADINDVQQAVTLIEAKVGITGTTVTSTQEYLINSSLRIDVGATITAVHRLSPLVVSPPFVLGLNAVGQTVTGLKSGDTEKLAGVTPSAFALTWLDDAAATATRVTMGIAKEYGDSTLKFNSLAPSVATDMANYALLSGSGNGSLGYQKFPPNFMMCWGIGAVSANTYVDYNYSFSFAGAESTRHAFVVVKEGIATSRFNLKADTSATNYLRVYNSNSVALNFYWLVIGTY